MLDTVLGAGSEHSLCLHGISDLVEEQSMANGKHSILMRAFLLLVVIVCVCVCVLLSHVQLFVTPWTVARQASLSMEFPRQEFWSG